MGPGAVGLLDAVIADGVLTALVMVAMRCTMKMPFCAAAVVGRKTHSESPGICAHRPTVNPHDEKSSVSRAVPALRFNPSGAGHDLRRAPAARSMGISGGESHSAARWNAPCGGTAYWRCGQVAAKRRAGRHDGGVRQRLVSQCRNAAVLIRAASQRSSRSPATSPPRHRQNRPNRAGTGRRTHRFRGLWDNAAVSRASKTRYSAVRVVSGWNCAGSA